MTTRTPTFLVLCLLLACGPDTQAFVDDMSSTDESVLDEVTASVTDDDLNGLWLAKVDGVALNGDAVVESWAQVGVRLHLDNAAFTLVRSGDVLSGGSSVSLAVKANGSGVANDTLEGTVNGHAVVLARDTSVKAPLALAFTGDRPWRSLLTEVLVPLAQEDRESYTVLHSASAGAWLRSCELYRHGSWQRTFMKGATWGEQSASFNNIIFAVNNLKTTPRRLTKEYRFNTAVKNNLADPSKVALALSTFSMYFAAASGRSVTMQFAPDSVANFITDRPSRGARIGLVTMTTPTHGPLASTFGRQLLDLGEMSPADDSVYAKVMMQLLVKSEVSGAVGLSGVGRSALTDWFAVMAIEDYRGMAFGYPTLGWGYNMTNVQFYGLVVRSLARPGAVDQAGNAVKGQVMVGNELRPGEPSYADVLNGGADMQEYSDMARLKQLATQFLRERHPAVVAELEASFAGVVPTSQLDSRARNDVFHFICAQLYDSRSAVLKNPVAADRVVSAVTAMFEVLRADSAGFESWLAAHGVARSNVPAPRSTGF